MDIESGTGASGEATNYCLFVAEYHYSTITKGRAFFYFTIGEEPCNGCRVPENRHVVS